MVKIILGVTDTVICFCKINRIGPKERDVTDRTDLQYLTNVLEHPIHVNLAIYPS